VLPDVPVEVSPSLTMTADRVWVVWAYKVARPCGTAFEPIGGTAPYPVDAIAECCRDGRHNPPEPTCTCGFHALSTRIPVQSRLLQLEVVLSGRVLAFECHQRAVLFRASRQTVIRVNHDPTLSRWKPPLPDDPGNRLARRRRRTPRGGGPFRLRLPEEPPLVVAIADDPGLCVMPLSATRLQETPLLVKV
jgi:hypothetical protein